MRLGCGMSDILNRTTMRNDKHRTPTLRWAVHCKINHDAFQKSLGLTMMKYFWVMFFGSQLLNPSGRVLTLKGLGGCPVLAVEAKSSYNDIAALSQLPLLG